jgi:hypothetical protein
MIKKAASALSHSLSVLQEDLDGINDEQATAWKHSVRKVRARRQMSVTWRACERVSSFGFVLSAGVVKVVARACVVVFRLGAGVLVVVWCDLAAETGFGACVGKCVGWCFRMCLQP